MSNFITLTRVYKNKGQTGLNQQSIKVRKSAVASIRPSNRLGYPAHRSTITLMDGTSYDLADKYSVVSSAAA